MTTLKELQGKLIHTYTQKGKGIDDFTAELGVLIDKGFSREKALINLALQNDIEIGEIRDMEKRGLSREEAILRFSEDLKRAEEFSETLSSYPRKTVVRLTPNSLWYLLPLAMGLIGGLIAYVYLRDDNPEMAKDLFTVGLIVSIIIAILVYIAFFPRAF